MQALSNLSEPENKTVNPLYIRQNKGTMRLGSAWAARTCTGNKHLKPHLCCDKGLCWQRSTITMHAAGVQQFSDFQSKTKENSAVLNFLRFSIFCQKQIRYFHQDANFIYLSICPSIYLCIYISSTYAETYLSSYLDRYMKESFNAI